MQNDDEDSRRGKTKGLKTHDKFKILFYVIISYYFLLVLHLLDVSSFLHLAFPKLSFFFK